MSQAIEIVLFHAKAGVSAEQLQAAAARVNPVLRDLPGFISRELGSRSDGQFVDIVHWADMASAEAAAQSVMSMPVFMEFFQLIDDQAPMSMMHFHKHWSL